MEPDVPVPAAAEALTRPADEDFADHELVHHLSMAACTTDWNELIGCDAVRTCPECKQPVYDNLQVLTAEILRDAARTPFIKRQNGDRRLYRRADGRYMLDGSGGYLVHGFPSRGAGAALAITTLVPVFLLLGAHSPISLLGATLVIFVAEIWNLLGCYLVAQQRNVFVGAIITILTTFPATLLIFWTLARVLNW